MYVSYFDRYQNMLVRYIISHSRGYHRSSLFLKRNLRSFGCKIENSCRIYCIVPLAYMITLFHSASTHHILCHFPQSLNLILAQPQLLPDLPPPRTRRRGRLPVSVVEALASRFERLEEHTGVEEAICVSVSSCTMRPE